MLLYAHNALQWEWGNFPFANWNGICWGLPLQLVQLIKIHFLPHLESFMWERKFEKKFFKKSHIQTPNGVLLIFKLPFPNGSYRNGVCRALWALSGWAIWGNLLYIPLFLTIIVDESVLIERWTLSIMLLIHSSKWYLHVYGTYFGWARLVSICWQFRARGQKWEGS